MNTDKIRRALDILLPLVGIGLMVYYGLCDTTCSSLKGTFLTVDLKGIGILFMAVLLVLTLPGVSRLPAAQHLRTAMLSSAIGGEILLVRFQLVHQTYCPFCLAFGLCLVILFAAHIPKMHKGLALASLAAGLAAFALFFKGSVLPLYG